MDNRFSERFHLRQSLVVNSSSTIPRLTSVSSTIKCVASILDSRVELLTRWNAALAATRRQ